MIDSHAHMDSIFYHKDRNRVLKKCINNGIEAIINPGTDYKSSVNSVKLAESYDFIYAAIGIHPFSTDLVDDRVLDRFTKLVNSRKMVAIGEIGLDYHNKKYDRLVQRKWFKKQLVFAKEMDLPVIVHSRKADNDILEIVHDVGLSKKGGVIHSFDGDLKMAEKYICSGFHISISGKITYANYEYLIDVVKQIDLDNILVETDSPYLMPGINNKKRNYPVNLKYVIESLSKIKEVSTEEISAKTASNTRQLFGI